MDHINRLCRMYRDAVGYEAAAAFEDDGAECRRYADLANDAWDEFEGYCADLADAFGIEWREIAYMVEAMVTA